jgi:hypothetical protein
LADSENLDDAMLFYQRARDLDGSDKIEVLPDAWRSALLEKTIELGRRQLGIPEDFVATLQHELELLRQEPEN